MSSVAYDYREPEGWAERVSGFDQKYLDEGAEIVLYGRCPRCHHEMDVELPIALQTGGLKVSQAADSQLLERTARADDGQPGSAEFEKIAHCNCQMPHKGRPDDAKEGCGAFGALVIG